MRGDESALLEQVCDAIRASPWSLEQISQEAHVSLTTLYLWTAGTTRDPRIKTLERVANALGYEIKLSRGVAHLIRAKSNGAAAAKPKAKWWEAYLPAE